MSVTFHKVFLKLDHQVFFNTLIFFLLAGCNSAVYQVVKQESVPTTTVLESEQTLRNLPGLLDLADKDHAPSQFRLGVIYANGDGVTKNLLSAYKWYLMASEQGLSEAQYNLAYLYLMGEGVAREEGEAYRWYLAAAENGLAAAQFNLALMYQDGLGVNRSIEKALEWTQKAADQGYINAMFNLATWHGSGELGLTVDNTEAFKWYLRAAKRGLDVAKYIVGVRYFHGESVSLDPVVGYAWIMAIGNKTELVEDKLKEMEKGLSAEQIRQAEYLLAGCRASNTWECI